jgi:hypothetical protein
LPHRRFVAAKSGNDLNMERHELLEEMLDASTPNETSTAISDARDWLRDHPGDQTVISAMEDLIEVERETLGAYF